jgi:hypothetical protein
MTCSGCHKKIGLYGSVAVRISGEPDINLCPDCNRAVKSAINNALFMQGINNVAKKINATVISVSNG